MNNNAQQPNPQIQSFLESLKARSSGLPRPEGQFGPSVERFGEKKKLEEARKAEFFRNRSREFNSVYSHTQQAEEQKIEELQKKLRALANSIKTLNNEVHTASIQTLPKKASGAYYESFIDHLSSMIDLLRKQVDSSSSWLQMFNSRSKKQGYYWDMADKKGTSFSMSNERQVATSVG